jgi:hypothetical protein
LDGPQNALPVDSFRSTTLLSRDVLEEVLVNRHIAVLLAVLLFATGSATPAFAGTKAEKEMKFAARVREGITGLGTGPDARIKVKLRDKTKLAGYVSHVGDSDFKVVDAAGRETTVQFPDVAQVQGNNLRTRWKVVIGAAIVAGIIITLYIVRGAFCDGC